MKTAHQNVPTPQNDEDVANKGFVDGAVAAAGTTGSVVSHAISGASRSSYNSQTPLVVGSFAFNPSDYTVNATPPTLEFRAVAANGVAALTNHVKLVNVTDAADVVVLNFTTTAAAKQVAALTIGGGVGQIPNSEKIYEIQIYLGADPAGDPNKTIELYSAHLVAVSAL
jgi:hypothetical protein